MAPIRSFALALVALGAAACRTTLQAGLSESDANQLLVALDSAAIAADKNAEGGAQDSYRVDVPTSEAARALRVLALRGLPRQAQAGFDGLYAEPGLLATPSEERARGSAALAGELARSIERLPAVVEARVHLALLAPVSALDSEPPPPRAAVLIRRRANAAVIDEAPIQKLVCGAVQGLAPAEVTIVQVADEPEPARGVEWMRVGPFTASRASAPALRAVLASALALHVVLALALIIVVRRRRRPAPG